MSIAAVARFMNDYRREQAEGNDHAPWMVDIELAVHAGGTTVRRCGSTGKTWTRCFQARTTARTRSVLARWIQVLIEPGRRAAGPASDLGLKTLDRLRCRPVAGWRKARRRGRVSTCLRGCAREQEGRWPRSSDSARRRRRGIQGMMAGGRARAVLEDAVRLPWRVWTSSSASRCARANRTRRLPVSVRWAACGCADPKLGGGLGGRRLRDEVTEGQVLGDGDPSGDVAEDDHPEDGAVLVHVEPISRRRWSSFLQFSRSLTTMACHRSHIAHA